MFPRFFFGLPVPLRRVGVRCTPCQLRKSLRTMACRTWQRSSALIGTLIRVNAMFLLIGRCYGKAMTLLLRLLLLLCYRQENTNTLRTSRESAPTHYFRGVVTVLQGRVLILLQGCCYIITGEPSHNIMEINVTLLQRSVPTLLRIPFHPLMEKCYISI